MVPRTSRLAMESEDESMNDPKSLSASSTSHSNSGSQNDQDEQLVQYENRAVFRLQMLLLLILTCVALSICLGIYFLTARSQQEQFEVQFAGSAEMILSSFGNIVTEKIHAIEALSVGFTSYANAVNATFPFVTMNDFQYRAQSVRDLSQAYFLEFLPVITDKNRLQWEEYALENKGWLDEGRKYQDELGIGLSRRLAESLTGDNVLDFISVNGDDSSVIADQIFTFDENWAPMPEVTMDRYFPIWQSAPILPEPRDLVNYNLLHYPAYSRFVSHAADVAEVTMGGIDTAAPGGITHPELDTSFFAFILSFGDGKIVEYKGDPMSAIYVPVFDSHNADKNVVGVILAVINWATYFENVLPPNSGSVNVVLRNSCEGPFTYRIDGPDVYFEGKGDLHGESHVEMTFSIDLSSNGDSFVLNQDLCKYSVEVYPTEEMYEVYNTSLPMVLAISLGIVFMFTIAAFLLYGDLVERRQKRLMTAAKRSRAIVSSLFPRQIRDRLFENENDSAVHGTKTKLKSFLSGQDDKKGVLNSAGRENPIADLFAETTVLFADVVGFTAWSSVREPSQVFLLLETLYESFDQIAARRCVFKVETVGDCYVAVTGIPDPRKDHAVMMARFAKEILMKMSTLTRELEVSLGPDTGDLRLRIGMNSGPVTAGVLRGDRARFQLFGDTMNTAARMESCSLPNKILISQETADLLKDAGKASWIVPREELVNAKGKGSLQTYWLNTPSSTDEDARSRGSQGPQEIASSLASTNPDITPPSLNKTNRLIEWNVAALSTCLRHIIARRNAGLKRKTQPLSFEEGPIASHPLDEVCEIITLPKFQSDQGKYHEILYETQVDEIVIQQLRCFVANIAELYRDNPFHNFEHASHVAMSVMKLMSRIVAPSDLDFANGRDASSSLHDHTYGITSDPLTQFAGVFSALIHDVDHQGVPNTQLVKEDQRIAQSYGGRSVAEQNSVDIAWALLMEEQYKELRATVYANQEEHDRFRQLVVNSVMATDIMDKGLKTQRNERWDKAFKECLDEGTSVAVNRKATIVIEHLIQASDVSHTMQHWAVFQKWNERLFAEMYTAYKSGRADKNPAEFWYKGEIGFFDFYIIPLAKKLRECGVFGVSSDEYLNYATQNRKEWELRGEKVVADMVERVCKKIDSKFENAEHMV